MFNTEELFEVVGSEILRRRGKPFTDELLNQMMGRQASVALQIMIDWHQLDVSVEMLQEESELIFSSILDSHLQTMPGLLELMDALETAGIPKAIATSSHRSFVRRVLGQFQLEPRFQFLLTAEDIAHGKPHPEIYRTAAELFGLAPHEVLVLEDSENGCRAAVDAGTFAVAVPHGRSRSHDFRGARFVAHSLEDRRIYEALGL
jgi:HAD superfamily hydrolase (TIGR01509 family)